MAEQDLILIEILCVHYNIERVFIDELHEMGLIDIQIVEQESYMQTEKINDLEKILRIHHELNVNMEGIDVVFNLLEKETALREELKTLKNRLRRYEND
jgi:hypothetical protein